MYNKQTVTMLTTTDEVLRRTSPGRAKAWKKATKILRENFSPKDRIDRWEIQGNEEDGYELLVLANKGNVGTRSCEFLYRL